MNVLSPGALDTMFGTLIGQLVLGTAAALFLIGFFVINRITKVKF